MQEQYNIEDVHYFSIAGKKIGKQNGKHQELFKFVWEVWYHYSTWSLNERAHKTNTAHSEHEIVLSTLNAIHYKYSIYKRNTWAIDQN